MSAGISARMSAMMLAKISAKISARMSAMMSAKMSARMLARRSARISAEIFNLYGCLATSPSNPSKCLSDSRVYRKKRQCQEDADLQSK